MGPSVHILVRGELDGTAREKLIACITAIADDGVRSHGDFWIEGRPLFFSIGWDYPEEPVEYEALVTQLGWVPREIIGLGAMCNDHEDHEVLGRVTLQICRCLDGVVAFGSSLHDYARDPKFVELLKPIDHAGESFLTAEQFETWLRHPNFQMVK